MYYSEININILSSLFAFISTELEILFAHFFFFKVFVSRHKFVNSYDVHVSFESGRL